jgi:outer membrane protein assembly factor BamB
MLNGRNRITWTWTSNGPPLTDIPIVDSTGTIYVLGYDLLWAAIESETGREKWRGIANGRALYSQLELFQGDTYLVVTDMSAYRESLHEFIKDKLTLCRGNAVLWDTEIPAGARIRVSGKRVFMIYRHKKHLVRVPFSVPPHLSKPLGKISVLADYD